MLVVNFPHNPTGYLPTPQLSWTGWSILQKSMT